MKDIVESTIIMTLLVAMIFFMGVFFAYIFGMKDYLRIPEKEWNCTKSQMIDEKNVDKVKCIRYERIETR